MLPASAVPVSTVPLVGATTGTAGGVVSFRLTLTVVLAPVPVLPALSVAVADTTTPLPSGVPGMYDQLPLASVPTVASMVPLLPISMLTWLPASAMPVSIVPSVAAMPGAGGGAVSMVTVNDADASLLFPAASVATAVSVYVALGSAAGETCQLPLTSATALPISAVPLNRLTVAPASATPLMTGVASLVAPPGTMAVAGVVLSLLTPRMVGTSGTAISTVRTNAALGALTLPAASVAVAVSVCSPVSSACEVNVQPPVAVAVTVPSSVVPS